MSVERPTFHESWYRVADIHPRLSSTVQISRQHFRGLAWHVVQDHTNNAFFRLAEPAYRFIGLLDGKRTVGDAWKITNEQLGDEAPTQGEVIQLLGQLYTANLLQADVPADTHTLFSRYRKRKQREITSYLMNIMFARIPIIDPDAFLNRWLVLLGWIFSPVGLVVWLILIALGLHAVMQVPGWQAEVTKGGQGLLSPDNLVLLYIAFSFIKACHEMGHAISCKKFGRQSGTGGEVHIIGIMFLVFTPVPYVDASSSWALRNKWHRAIVGAAGMWVELGIASIAAMVWARTGDASWIHAFAYNVMFVASFSTVVFNANPLLRYDGYYIVSDLLEIPNLATRGKEYIFYLVKRYIWNVRHARNPAHTPAEKFWLFVYAIASFVMRCFVTFSIMFYLSGVLNGTLIILATAMALAGLITWLFVPIGKFLHYLSTSPELGRSRTRAFLTSGAVIAAVVLGVGFIPVPDRSRSQGVVEPQTGDLAELFSGVDGAVEVMHIDGDVDAGDALSRRLAVPVVRKGDVLLRLSNPKMEAELKSAKLEVAANKARYNLAVAQSVQPTQGPNEIQAVKEALEASEKEVARLQAQIDRLELKAPLDGMLVTPGMEEKTAAYMKRTDRVGIVANLHELIIRTAAGNELSGPLHDELQGKKRVEIRVNGRPDILLTGEILAQSSAGSTDLPSPALGYQVGGLLNTAPDDRQGTKAVENFFEVRIGNLKLIDAPKETWQEYEKTGDVPLLPGQRVIVRFEFKPKPIIVQVWTGLRQVFQKKFQL